MIVWQKAMKLRANVRGIALSLPVPDRWDVGRQACRSALAIPSIVAEGHGRPGREDYKNYLSMAHGEGAELDTQLIVIAEDFPNLSHRVTDSLGLLDEVSRMLMAIYVKVK
jgi:four helix bundle protein